MTVFFSTFGSLSENHSQPSFGKTTAVQPIVADGSVATIRSSSYPRRAGYRLASAVSPNTVGRAARESKVAPGFSAEYPIFSGVSNGTGSTWPFTKRHVGADAAGPPRLPQVPGQAVYDMLLIDHRLVI